MSDLKPEQGDMIGVPSFMRYSDRNKPSWPACMAPDGAEPCKYHKLWPELVNAICADNVPEEVAIDKEESTMNKYAEKLRANKSTFATTLYQSDLIGAADEIDRLDARIEVLRGALETIVDQVCLECCNNNTAERALASASDKDTVGDRR